MLTRLHTPDQSANRTQQIAARERTFIYILRIYCRGSANNANHLALPNCCKSRLIWTDLWKTATYPTYADMQYVYKLSMLHQHSSSRIVAVV